MSGGYGGRDGGSLWDREKTSVAKAQKSPGNAVRHKDEEVGGRWAPGTS